MEGVSNWSSDAISTVTKSFEHWLRHASSIRFKGADESVIFYDETKEMEREKWEDLLESLHIGSGSVNCEKTGKRFRSTGLVKWKEMKLHLSLQLYRLGKDYEGIPLQITFWNNFCLTDLVLPNECGTNHCLCMLNLSQKEIQNMLNSQKGRRSTTVRDILVMAYRFDI